MAVSDSAVVDDVVVDDGTDVVDDGVVALDAYAVSKAIGGVGVGESGALSVRWRFTAASGEAERKPSVP